MTNLRIVALGGGTGLSTLLRGLKHHTDNLTAIVTIADDGGSSGRLRQDFGMPPPGDARNCLVALSRAEPLMGQLFDHRFATTSSLNGHSLGNLLLAALFELYGGFRQGLEAAAQLLAISGRVIPVSDHNDLTLLAETIPGQVVRGESAVGKTPGGLRRVWMLPEEAEASDVALEAIRQAELIVVGPGSLYTSLIPNFLLQGVSATVGASSASVVLVCNVATQPHETDGFGVVEHLRVFEGATGIAVTHLVVNSEVRELSEDCGQVAIQPVSQVEGFEGQVVLADLLDPEMPTRHDSEKLARAVMGIALG